MSINRIQVAEEIHCSNCRWALQDFLLCCKQNFSLWIRTMLSSNLMFYLTYDKTTLRPQENCFCWECLTQSFFFFVTIKVCDSSLMRFLGMIIGELILFKLTNFFFNYPLLIRLQTLDEKQYRWFSQSNVLALCLVRHLLRLEFIKIIDKMHKAY